MNMDLFCEKYKEKMTADDAVCRHPGEYCKFRTSCIINFMKKEKKESAAADDKGKDPCRSTQVHGSE